MALGGLRLLGGRRCAATASLVALASWSADTTLAAESDAGSGRADTRYHLEFVVRCGAGGDCDRFLRGGWAKPDQLFTWTSRTNAKLKFSLPPVKGPLGLRMRLMGNLQPPDLPVQLVEVFANGRKVALWLVDAADDFYAIVPSGVVRADGKLKVELKLPRAQRLPNSPPGETSRFGVACYEIEVSKAASVPSQLTVTPQSESPSD